MSHLVRILAIACALAFAKLVGLNIHNSLLVAFVTYLAVIAADFLTHKVNNNSKQ